VKYAWIRDHSDQFRVARMCRLLEISRSGYAQWRTRPPSARAQANAALDARIAAVHTDSGRAYGRPRVHRALRDSGVRVGHERVRRSLRRQGLASVLDLGTRAVVGWSMSDRMRASLVCDALKMAYWR
jgi:putative transposase